MSIVLPSIKIEKDKIKSVIGAGDSFLAGYVFAIVTDLNNLST
jgi:sugar/nucleoside kinase (ribokinase family)